MPTITATEAADDAYRGLLDLCLNRGSRVVTRNAAVRRVRGPAARFDRAPLVTLRRTPWKTALREWEWFMSGSNNVNDLHPSVRPWWQPWADKDGLVANNYSEQFRYANGVVVSGGPWPGETRCCVDQIANLVDGLKKHPFSRRHVLTTWNAAEMAHPSTPITNCHNTATQLFVEPDDSLHMETYQRSADVVVGLPANWIQQWAFLLWLARACGRKVGTLTWKGGDVHVYESHVDLAFRALLAPSQADPPGLAYEPSADGFRADDFALTGPYAPAITERAEMVV